MSFRTVIGLEVHVQLLTQTKLFCGCSTTFGLPPNSATCPICVGMPGTLPVMNSHAFRLALRAALALNCTIATFTKWDRKNYFYPDLPKNYQISQYDLPFSSNGWLEIETAAGPKRVGILRAHLEEDAGKMLHDESGGRRDSRVDLNRTGTPLLEIVSQPEMETAEEAKAYVETIRELLRGIEVSDCEMQEGSLRCDANVNLHVPQPSGPAIATPIIEIKNLNSIRGVERAIKHEIDRQHAELSKNLASGEWFLDPAKVSKFRGEPLAVVLHRAKDGRVLPVSKATAGWDDVRNKTDVQRRKEEAADYRYFPDPDLAPVTVSTEEMEAARQGLGETPAQSRARLASQYGLSDYDANGLTQKGRPMLQYFEAVVEVGGDAKEAANWILNDVLQTLNEQGVEIGEFSLTAARLGGLVVEAKKGLNKQQARKAYAEMIASDVDAPTAIKTLGIAPMTDTNELREIVRRAIAANTKAVNDYKKGKLKAADAIKGAVMKETKGAAKMEQVQAILIEELNAI